MKKGLRVVFWSLVLGFSSIALVVVFIAASLLLLPDIQQLEKCFTTSMFSVNLCPTSNNYVKLQQISPFAIHAIVASEDGSFYSHKGFDWHELEQSFNANLRSGKIQRGGSTLTQQLAKNAFLSQEKSYWRKVKEAYLAYTIEQKYSKSFILEKYLNVVEFGPNLYGIKAAARHYFHKSPSELNPLESAYLAFLLPNPKVYSKSFRSGQLTPFGRKMVNVILRRMNSFGKLSPAAYHLAVAQLPNFPWTGLSKDAFLGAPSYSLEANKPQVDLPNDSILDEEALEELLKEEEARLHKPPVNEVPAEAQSSEPTYPPPTETEEEVEIE